MSVSYRATARPHTPTKTFAALAALAVGTLAVIPALAQPAPAEGVEEIVITATRVPLAIDRVGSSISVVTRADIERSQQTQALDILRRLPGVSIARNGGAGSTSLIRLRGSEAGMVKVLVDGVELNDGASANREFDFNALLADDIDRIEVLRGPQGALYGNDAMAGVINILTRRGTGPLSATGTVEGGAHHTFRQAVSLSGASGGTDYALSANNFRSGGFSRVAAGGENDGTTSRSVRGRLGLALGGATVDLSAGWSFLDTEFDPLVGRDGPGSQEKETLYGRGAVMVEGMGGRLRTTATLGGSRTERDFDEPLGFYRFSTFDSDQVAADLLSSLSLRRDDIATIGLSWDREEAETTNTIGTTRNAGLDAGVDTWAVFGQYVAAVTEDLTLTAGLRHDDHEGFGGATTWRGTAAYALGDGGTVLRASYGTARKAPSLFQLYDPMFGNAALQAEKSWGLDAGVEQTLADGRLTLGATVFRTRYRNLIGFTSGYVNIGRAETSGLETTVTAMPLPRLEVTGSWTWLDTENRDTGRELPRRPRQSLSLTADYAVTADLGLGIDLVHATSQLDRNGTNVPRVEGYTAVHLLGRWAVTDSVTLFGRVENLFDEEYQEVLGYRTSGRAAYAGVRAAF